MAKHLATALFRPLVVVTILVAQGAQAEAEIFSCKDNHGFLLTKCALTDLALSAEPVYGNERYQAEFRILYSFPCSGHQPEIGIRSETSSARFELGASRATLYVTGTTAVHTFDPRPAETARLSFQPGCHLVVHQVTARPSINTIEIWTREAHRQAALVRMATDLFLVSVDFTNYWGWDQTRSQSLYRSVQEKTLAFEDLCREGSSEACTAKIHFMAVANALSQKIAQSPALPQPGALQNETRTLVEHYRAAMLTQADAGQFMVNRFQHFERPVAPELSSALAQVPVGEIQP